MTSPGGVLTVKQFIIGAKRIFKKCKLNLHENVQQYFFKKKIYLMYIFVLISENNHPHHHHFKSFPFHKTLVLKSYL